MRKERCSRCDLLPARPGQRYCSKCHNAYMREYRATHPLSPAAKERDRSRSLAYAALRRGKIERQGCVVCGSEAQMHHPDYARPLDVVWLCLEHHREAHRS